MKFGVYKFHSEIAINVLNAGGLKTTKDVITSSGLENSGWKIINATAIIEVSSKISMRNARRNGITSICMYIL